MNTKREDGMSGGSTASAMPLARSLGANANVQEAQLASIQRNLTTALSRERVERFLDKQLQTARESFNKRAGEYGGFMEQFLRSGGSDIVRMARDPRPEAAPFRQAMKDTLANAAQPGSALREQTLRMEYALRVAFADARKAIEAGARSGDVLAVNQVLEQANVLARGTRSYLPGLGMSAAGQDFARFVNEEVAVLEKVADRELAVAGVSVHTKAQAHRHGM